MSNSSQSRSWTASDQNAGAGRWVIFLALLIALVVSLFVLGFYLRPSDLPRTFAVSISVPEYTGKQDLPEPAYADWSMDQFVQTISNQGLDPWNPLGDQIWNSSSEFEIKRFEKSMLAAKVSPTDTFVVYLRCHALMIDGRAYALAGEFDGDDALLAADQPQPAAVPFDLIFQQLQQLPVANVIVLADVCDLPSVPRFGIMANHVVDGIGTACEKSAGSNQLWVITAGAPLQPNHESHVRRQTLLQSACEYACDARRTDASDGSMKFLSLAGMYDSIVRFSHAVTKGTQTPWLFRSGSSKNVTPSSLDWAVAQQLRVSGLQTDSVRNQVDSTKAKAEQLDPKSASTLRSGGLRLVSNRYEIELLQDNPQANPAQPSSPATSSATSQDAAATAPATASPPITPTIETTEWLRYWQLHDPLQLRKNPSGWSPADYNVVAWRMAQSEIVSLERRLRLGRIGGRDVGVQTVEDIKKVRDQLESLAQAMKSGGKIIGSSGELVDSWNRFLDDIQQSPSKSKLAWDNRNGSILPDDVRQRWEPIRNDYRAYIDISSEVGQWLQLCLMDPTWVNDVESLVTVCTNVHEKLPGDPQSSVLEQPLNREAVSTMTRRLEELRSKLSRQTRELISQLSLGTNSGNEKTNWTDERKVQVLLRSGLLSHLERKALLDAYDKLAPKDMIQPGAENQALDAKLLLEDLLSSSVVEPRLIQAERWATLLGRALGIAATEERLSSAADLNAWGKSLQAKLSAQGKNEKSPNRLWNLACLVEYQISGRELPNTASLILPVSSDTSVDVTMPTRHRLPAPLTFDVRSRNGAPVNQCELSWRLLNADQYSISRERALQVRDAQGVQLEAERVKPLSVVGGQVALSLSSELTSRSTSTPIELEIRVYDKSYKISLQPANPDSVEIYAKWTNSPNATGAVVRSEQKKQAGMEEQSVLSALRVPAIGGRATSKYEMYAFNLSDKPRKVQAKLYNVLPGGGQVVGSGVATGASMQRTLDTLRDLQPAFVSDVVDLPRNQDIGTNSFQPATTLPGDAAKLTFRRPPSGAPTAPDSGEEPPAEVGEFGLLCVIEEVDVLESNVVQAKLNGERYTHWIDIVGENPLVHCLTQPDLIPGERSFSLKLGIRPDVWEQLLIEELPIVVHLTDDLGAELSFEGNPREVLNLQNTSVDWSITPPTEERRGPSRSYVVHVDIGNYPRAVNFESRLGSSAMDAREALQSFIWLDRNSLVCLNTAGEPIPLAYLSSGQVVVPNRLQVSGESTGIEVQLGRLQLPLRTDFPSDRQLEVSLGQPPIRFSSDRRLRPRLLVKGSEFRLSAVAEDLLFEKDMRNFRLPGEQRIQVEVVNDSAPGARLDLMFDQTPPEAASVEVDANELYLEETLEISIRHNDEDSKVNEVYFAIDRNNVETSDKYDPKDIVRLTALAADDGRWTAILKDTDLVGANLTNQRLKVVSRAIDIAGNVRDDHRPAVFTWMNKKRPVSQPKPKPKQPAPKEAEKPKEPKTYTVTVRVTVGGEAPAFADKVDVVGVPGSKSQVKNIVKFVDVPEGNYEATAQYADPFGVKYAGKATIKVSETSSNSATIDASRE